MGKRQSPQQMVLGKLYIHMQDNEMGLYFIPYTKINSKQIKDINVILLEETVKLLEENIGENFYDIGLGNNFTDMTPKAQSTKAKIDKWE